MNEAAMNMIEQISEAIGGRKYWVRSLTDPNSPICERLVEFHLEATGELDEDVRGAILAILREHLPTPHMLRLFLSDGRGDYCGKVYAIQQTAKAVS